MSHYHTCTTVSLLRRPITNGRLSLYLDFYPAIRNPETMKMTRREYLGIYIFAKPRNDAEREFNRSMIERAEAIRCMRVTSLINEKFDFLDHEKMQGHCTCGEVTVDLCKKFREYLLGANQLRLTHLKISKNSAAGYYSTFRGFLNIAYREKMIKENVNDFLEKIETDDVRKEFLTSEELKKLAATPCDIPVLKQASLFSCLTGLRISDILNLAWDDIQLAPDLGYCVRIRIQKTDTETMLPISDEALQLCGERTEGKVFRELTRSMVNYPLRKWIAAAGIKKHISFHCFRHTYATLQIASGTDIYTVSKMLVHKNVTTTQIYADLVNDKKRETVDRITLK